LFGGESAGGGERNAESGGGTVQAGDGDGRSGSEGQQSDMEESRCCRALTGGRSSAEATRRLPEGLAGEERGS
jgi:hypothetical protein